MTILQDERVQRAGHLLFVEGFELSNSANIIQKGQSRLETKKRPLEEAWEKGRECGKAVTNLKTRQARPRLNERRQILENPGHPHIVLVTYVGVGGATAILASPPLLAELSSSSSSSSFPFPNQSFALSCALFLLERLAAFVSPANFPAFPLSFPCNRSARLRIVIDQLEADLRTLQPVHDNA
jgi:hypothetical protein